MLTQMPLPKPKKEGQPSLGVVNLSKCIPASTGMCEPLRRLTPVKNDWMWNNTCQEIYDKTTAIIHKDTCMGFYNKMKPLCIETNATIIVLDVGLLQIRHYMNYPTGEASDNTMLWPLTFARNNQSSAETR